MATINGTNGDDTLAGSAGDDTIYADQGADSVDAGAGNDYVFGDDNSSPTGGDDTLHGGEGNDTIEGHLGNDSLTGGAGADRLVGGGGADFVDGGDGTDTLYGNDGNDTIVGGAGDDLIYGDLGDDIIAAGPGNDTVYGHDGADQFVIASGSGFTSIEDYNAGDGDMLVVDYAGINTYTDLQPYLSDDGNFGTLVSLPDGSVTQVKWLNFASQSASNFTFQSGTVCVMKGTMIATARGPRAVETLRRGDLVETHDNGLQPLRHLAGTRYRFCAGPHRMKPIRFKPGALGRDYPARELLVSPQHRIALPPETPQHIVAARQFLARSGVSERPACLRSTYYHLLFDRHELIRANGLWVESLLLTGYSRARLGVLVKGQSPRPVRPILRTAQP